MEKEIETKNPMHKCFNCEHYKPYYLKYFACFDRCDFGCCWKGKANVDKHFTCDKWRSRKRYARDVKITQFLPELEKGLTDINAVKTILMEELERKNDPNFI